MVRPKHEHALLPAPEQIAELLVSMLAEATGTKKKRWREAIGQVEMLPLTMNVRCNWSVSPKGSDEDLRAIGNTVELVRTAHPYVG